MTDLEKLELLRAAVAVAAADGEILRCEKGVLEGLAARVGVGRASFEAMVSAAVGGERPVPDVLIRSPEKARIALELLVAQARLDGEISDEERELLFHLATRLGITGDDFQTVYQAGLTRADRLRQSRDAKS
jgi:tellurite resistance protein